MNSGGAVSFPSPSLSPGYTPQPSAAPAGGYATRAAPSVQYTQYAPPRQPPGGYHSGPYAPPPGPPRAYQPPQGPAPMPPTGQQSFGAYPTYGGQMQSDYFQYSQCNGRKKALLIGINYFGQAEALQGCIEDVNRMQRFLLVGRGYREENMVTLTDNSSNPRSQPTRQNIVRGVFGPVCVELTLNQLDAMQWLVRDAQPNDSLFFHYSGHGGQTPDLDGDEEDGYDEVIYPVDFKRTSHIVDDDMHDIMVSRLPAGCRLTAIFDVSNLEISCGNANFFAYDTEGRLKGPNMMRDAGKGLFSTLVSYEMHDVGGMMRGVSDLVKVASGKGRKADEYTRQFKSSPADVISWSGCKDTQTSADASIGGRSTGAMSDEHH
ncbi:metacaspase-1 [Chiua virens]|nr:metacaspase-1 [Chiua virens]